MSTAGEVGRKRYLLYSNAASETDSPFTVILGICRWTTNGILIEGVDG